MRAMACKALIPMPADRSILVPCSHFDQGAEWITVNGEPGWYRRQTMEEYDRKIKFLDTQVKMLLKQNGLMSGRDPLKAALCLQKQFDITPSNVILGLSTLSTSNNIPFSSTETACLVNEGHKFARKANLIQITMRRIGNRTRTYIRIPHMATHCHFPRCV